MLLQDIPDKLAITAFVYQMFNYFTMAVPSAIIKSTAAGVKDGSKQCPSPLAGFGAFDFSEIEKLTSKNMSPTTKEDPASKRNLTGNKWSKHSLKEEQELMEQQQQQREREHLHGDEAVLHGNEEGVVHTPQKADSSSSELITHSTPVTNTVAIHTTPSDYTESNGTTATSGPLPSNGVDLEHPVSVPCQEPSSPHSSSSNEDVKSNEESSVVQPLPNKSELSLPLSSLSDMSTDSKISSPCKTSDSEVSGALIRTFSIVFFCCLHLSRR